MYSQAIAGAPEDHTLYGNRSAAYLALVQYEEAAWDARKAAALAPDWPKACYRLGCALLGLSQWAEADAVLQRGLSLDPANPDMAAKQGEAAQRARAEAAARRAQAGTERRGIVAQMRAARRQDAQQAMINQFKQAMTAPDWEVEDLEWWAAGGGPGGGEPVG
jgi:stress-induced-phosphoprotein 1